MAFKISLWLFLFSVMIFQGKAAAELNNTHDNRRAADIVVSDPVALKKTSRFIDSEARASAIRKSLQKEKIPGAAFAIVENGQIVQVGTYGKRSLKHSDLVDSQTIFPLASVSKTFAGTLAASLASKEYLALEAPLAGYAPGFTLARPARVKDITLYHVLSHATGVVPNAYDNLLEAGQGIEDIIPRFGKLKPLCPPGVCYGYQNVIFSLIQPALEEAGGDSYSGLMQSRFFTPLGMDRSSIGFEAYQADANKVQPHVKSRKRYYTRQMKPNYYRASPAAGINASIQDMATWLVAQMGYRPDVLTEEALKLAHQPRVSTVREKSRRYWKKYLTDAHYALGWRIYEFSGELLILHSGGLQGIRTHIGWSPDRNIGFVLLINADTRVHDEIATEFWANILPQKAKGR